MTFVCFWLDVAKIALKKQQRESEEEDAEAAIAVSMRRINSD